MPVSRMVLAIDFAANDSLSITPASASLSLGTNVTVTIVENSGTDPVNAVQADLTYGSQIGIQGTPGFFVNGRLISGACPDGTFKSAIEAELAGKDWDAPNCQFVEL